MINVKSLLAVVALVFATQVVNAQRIEVGIGSGTTHPTQPKSFKTDASAGNAVQYFIGYGLGKNWGVELGHDVFDFDGVDSKNKSISLAGTYRFLPEHKIHPIAKFGIGVLESKNAAGDDLNSTNGKAAIGIEADFKYISMGALFNYIYAQKVQVVAGETKNAQAIIPALFIAFHNAVDTHSTSESKAPKATSASSAVVAASVDTDGDGVSDEDDKCPNTKTGVVVNKFGCAETEKASIKLEVEFATGKADLDSAFDGEIQKLADFMTKFPETRVEIGGHSDNTGSEALNKNLSGKRAESVKNALIKAGIDAKRLTSKGYGSSQPVADNSTAAGRQANRRVVAEISVIQEKTK